MIKLKYRPVLPLLMLCYQIGVEIFQSRLGYFHLLERVVGVRTRCSICAHFSRRSEILRRNLTENSLHVTGNFLTWPIGNKLLMTRSSPTFHNVYLLSKTIDHWLVFLWLDEFMTTAFIGGSSCFSRRC